MLANMGIVEHEPQEVYFRDLLVDKINKCAKARLNNSVSHVYHDHD